MRRPRSPPGRVVKTAASGHPRDRLVGRLGSLHERLGLWGRLHALDTAGAYVLIAFKGTQLDWITMKGTTGAIADIYVDGSPTKAATVNLYASPAVYQQNLWTTGTLPDGYHTVKIVEHRERLRQVSHHRRASRWPAPFAPTRIEENAPQPFTWNPASPGPPAPPPRPRAAPTIHEHRRAYVSFNFTGVGFQLIAKTAPSYGNLTVTIDGVSQTVSLYSAATTYKKMVLTKFLRRAPTQ